METGNTIKTLRWVAVCFILIAGIVDSKAQETKRDSAITAMTDSIEQVIDSLLHTENRPAVEASGPITAIASDSILSSKDKLKKPQRDWTTWKPDPKRAMWLALVIPGGGQIYNRKYWKLPIVYGGFLGCAYAMNWNNMMYKSYAQAYLDIMDDDPGTASYNQFLHLGRQIDSSNEERYKEIFRKRKDKFRRWRDMSFFVMVGVYAISVIDAYVDAELSVFDISKDLSLKIEPIVINTNLSINPVKSTSLGLQCSLNF